jgi:hypothetical protein
VKTVLQVGALAIMPLGALAQQSLTEQTLEVLPAESGAEEFGIRAGSVVAAPIRSATPRFGNGLALAPRGFSMPMRDQALRT